MCPCWSSPITFLDAPSHLYKRSCLSVRLNVPRYFRRWKERVLGASCAVYPALFISPLTPLHLLTDASDWRQTRRKPSRLFNTPRPSLKQRLFFASSSFQPTLFSLRQMQRSGLRGGCKYDNIDASSSLALLHIWYAFRRAYVASIADDILKLTLIRGMTVPVR